MPTEAPPGSPEHYVSKAKELAASIPGSFRVDQYDNLKNPDAHYRTTAPEIWEQTGGQVDYFIASASTGGTITGVGRFLKERRPGVKIVMPDPVGSIYTEYFKTHKIPSGGNCNYLLEGIGEDHLTKAIDFSVIDDVFNVTDRDAFLTARKLAAKEGILAGGSSGVNVWAAQEIAKRLTSPAVIVTVLPDSGVKYLSKCFNDDWMKSNHFL
jgi:cystathionine beta-synthase/cysteine synthase A